MENVTIWWRHHVYGIAFFSSPCEIGDQVFRALDCKIHVINSLQWRHNGQGSVSNHQPHDCLLNRLFRHRSNKTLKLRVTGEFPTQMVSNAENVFIWWRHHVIGPWEMWPYFQICDFQTFCIEWYLEQFLWKIYLRLLQIPGLMLINMLGIPTVTVPDYRIIGVFSSGGSSWPHLSLAVNFHRVIS